MSYTDHFGVEAVFEVAAEQEHNAADSALSAVAARNLSTTLSSAIAALGAYTHHAGQTQRTHLLGFAGCVTTALGLAVMTPFIGYRGYSFWAGLAVVLATAAGFGGTTLLYSGLIWGEWEKSESHNGSERPCPVMLTDCRLAVSLQERYVQPSSHLSSTLASYPKKLLVAPTAKLSLNRRHLGSNHFSSERRQRQTTKGRAQLMTARYDCGRIEGP